MIIIRANKYEILMVISVMHITEIGVENMIVLILTQKGCVAHAEGESMVNLKSI